MHVPVHPVTWPDSWLCRVFRAFADFRGIFFGNQPALKEHSDFRLEFFAAAVLSVAQFFRQPFAHFFPHEYGVGADVNDPSLREQSFDQCFDMRIDQRLAAADGNHRRVALLSCRQAVLQAHYVLERRRVFANPSATGAREIARMQRLELKHRGKFLGATQLVADYVRSDFRRERKRKSHKSEDFTERRSGCQ